MNDTFVNVLTGVFNFSEPGSPATPGAGRRRRRGDLLRHARPATACHVILQNPPTGAVRRPQLDRRRRRGPAGARQLHRRPAPGQHRQRHRPAASTSASAPQPRRVGRGPNGARHRRRRPCRRPASPASRLGPSPRNSATLTVGGPDICAYKYKLDNGAWSAEVPVTNPRQANAVVPPIQLTGLANGTSHGLRRRARTPPASGSPTPRPRRPGRGPSTPPLAPASASTRCWPTTAVHVDAGPVPDLIELYNDGTGAVDLVGHEHHRQPGQPAEVRLPRRHDDPGRPATSCSTPTTPTAPPGIHLGFALDKDGEGVYLYDTPPAAAASSTPSPSARQLHDLSIGRVRRRRAPGA